ncbi:MAG: hypothetical protein ACOYLS_06660 [Polymorphobacter sp.]
MESLILSIRIERRWPLWAALVVAIGWGMVAGFDIALRTPPQPSLLEIAAIVLAVLPPLALALLVAALLPGAGRSLALADAEDRLAGACAQADALASRIDSVDAGLARSVDRTRALAETASASLSGLGGSAAAIEAAAARVLAGGQATQRITDGFGAALPALARTIADIDTTLRAASSDSAVQLRAVEAVLAAVQTRNRDAITEADGIIARLTGLLARIDEASSRNTAALSKRAYALDAAVDGVLERTTAAVDHMREAVEGQLRGLESGVDSAGRQLTLLGDDGARLFSERLELLVHASGQLQDRFSAHEADAQRLQALVGAQLGDLDQRLARLAATGDSTLGQIGTGLSDVRTQIAALAAPLSASQASVVEISTLSNQLQASVGSIDDALNERLSRSRQSMMALENEAQRLFNSVAGLGTAVTDGAAMIDGAATVFAAERENVLRLARQLEGEFDTARSLIAEIETSSSAAAASVAAGLGGEVSRLADAADAAAASMRNVLAAVVDDAVAALDSAASGRAEAAFGAPVRAQIDAIEVATSRAAAAGQDAAGRIAAQMLRLVETVTTVEARVDEVEARFAVRSRDSIARSSARIIAQLGTAAVDVAQLLDIHIGDADWAAYLGGDRSIFARAIVPQLDRDAARKMARLYQHDPEFRREATRYAESFEALIARMLGDTDGETLAATLLSSDIGKIYIALADATQRLPPSR